MEYLGIDWSYRRAAWCSLSAAGAIVGEGAVPADADGLARLVIDRGTDVRAVVEMMSGAIWVRDQLAAAGWRVQIAHARKVRDVAPLRSRLREHAATRTGQGGPARAAVGVLKCSCSARHDERLRAGDCAAAGVSRWRLRGWGGGGGTGRARRGGAGGGAP